MPCKFCKSLKVVKDKNICRVCLRLCVACSVEDDNDKCPRAYYRISCGAMLEAGCERCGKTRSGNKYCKECGKIMKRVSGESKVGNVATRLGITLGMGAQKFGESIITNLGNQKAFTINLPKADDGTLAKFLKAADARRNFDAGTIPKIGA